MISIKHHQKCIHCGRKVISFRQKKYRDYPTRPAHRKCWIRENEKQKIDLMIQSILNKQ
jgi:hypothetical protein